MRKSLILHLAIAIVAIVIGLEGAQQTLAGDSSRTADDTSDLQTALDGLDRWIGDGANGDRWRQFLATDTLRKQMAKGKDADPAVVALVLNKYRSGERGLDMSRFVAVQQELHNWLVALKQQYAGDLSKMAWAARGDYHFVPKSQRLGPARDVLLERAQRLKRTLGGNSQFAQNWKRFLKWELLEPHFSDDVSIDSQSLEDLRLVLRRFRSNHPGLENPVFTSTADALEQYRGIFAWYELVQQYDRLTRRKYSAAELERRVYILQLTELEKQLSRHQQEPTIETTRKIAQLLGLVEHLQQSPQLARAIKIRYSQPNLLTEVSESALNRIARQPVNETQPVRDCILGAQIRGMATSTGVLTYETHPAGEHIEIEVQLAGKIRSDTVGYRKPVRISTFGDTDFVAVKRIEISDEQFLATPATVSASTKTQIRAVNKVGGRFGRRLIERIAWKKVFQTKRLGERIAAQRAEERVAAKFDDRLVEALYEARNNYDEKLRSQLVRVGLFPRNHRMASSDDSVAVSATFASLAQVSTVEQPPSTALEGDLCVRVHETAVNNYLPILLAGVVVSQDEETEPPRLKGDVPSWLRKVIKEHGGDRQLSVQAGEEEIDEAIQVKPNSQTAETKNSDFEFKPFSLRLNRTDPMSVNFDDQQLKLRIRFAEMITIENGEETVREDWDFLITFEVLQKDDGVVLRRIGKIEAFPTGFDPDPRWGDKLTSEQVATRGALAKVLENRAKSREGFPTEITLPAVQLPSRTGIEQPLVLKQLNCDNGWLTVTYQLP